MRVEVWAASRIPCSGLRRSSVLSTVIFRPACRDLRITPADPYGILRRSFSSLNLLPRDNIRPTSVLLFPQHPIPLPFQRRYRRSLASQAVWGQNETLPDKKTLPKSEIKAIFGRDVPVELGNRILAVLHARRLEGTLDLDLPNEIARAFTQPQLDNALDWLREKYPLDEDSAILARIEREEREAEEKLVRRAEELGLYKPQSGSYGAERGENDPVYGKSVLKEARELNERRLLDEKERKRQQWLEGENEERERLQRQIHENTALQQYQESALMEGTFARKLIPSNNMSNVYSSPSS